MRGEVTWEGHQQYFQQTLADSSQVVYAICLEGVHIGNCGYKNLDIKEREGELWIYIGEHSIKRRGIGSQAARLLLEKGFYKIGLEKVYLHVADFNRVARKVYQRLGFREVYIDSNKKEWNERGCKVLRLELLKGEFI